jgi:hypothetical protein
MSAACVLSWFGASRIVQKQDVSHMHHRPTWGENAAPPAASAVTAAELPNVECMSTPSTAEIGALIYISVHMIKFKCTGL